MRDAPSSEDGRDLISIRGLTLKTITGTDSWQRLKPQPVVLSLWLRTSIALAGSTDHLGYSIHYGIACKAVTELVEKGQFNSLEHLAERVSALALGDKLKGDWVKVVVDKPRALLRAEAAGISIIRTKKEGELTIEEDKVYIKDLKLACIIGVNPWERLEKQNVIINITLYKPASPPVPESEAEEYSKQFDSAYDFYKVTNTIADYVEKSDYKTIEAFVTAIAKVACTECGVDKITVRAEKPSALTFAKAAGVEITRHRSFFQQDKVTVDEHGRLTGRHVAYVALGSNIGDRRENIEKALQLLDGKTVKVGKTSSLYETEPMYVLDQPKFLNGVCQVETTLEPHELLRELQRVENEVGRVKLIEKGPRCIDLDILLYDQIILDTPDLKIPHIGMLEREFVLRPLCDVAPHLPHPQTSTAFITHLHTLPPSAGPIRAQPYCLFPPAPSLNPEDPLRSTILMAVLNLTPDSFSDGGKIHQGNLIERATNFVANGATILDIGGASTRPGAQDVPVEKEIQRVVPAIKLLRESGITAAISVDTFHSEVARAALTAGANIINDITAGAYDPKMFSTVIEFNAPICLMHMRGNPRTMNALNKYSDNLIDEIAEELNERLEAALQAGVRRWNIMLDPGLGFAKDKNQNLEIIRRLGELRAKREFRALPWLLGPSRKRFVGTVTGVKEAGERQWGTAGAVAACVAGGADIVRVHDVEEMSKVMAMADSIWRVKG